MNQNPGVVSSGLPVVVTGTVTANLGTIDGAATEATLQTVAAVPTTISSFKTTVTTAGTRVQLANHACLSVTVKARSNNTGLIYVGDVTVTSSNGFELSAGESVSFVIDNTNRLYIDSSVNGEGTSSICVNT